MKDRDLYIHEQRIVELRTYKSIGDELGITRQRVRQIVETVSRHIRWQQEIESLHKLTKMCHLVLPRRIKSFAFMGHRARVKRPRCLTK
jgi:hypothetical protein